MTSLEQSNELMQWYNDTTHLFMSRGYLEQGQGILEKIKDIGDHAESILKIEGFSDKLQEYIKRGYYIIPTPVWKNFNSKSKESSISCFGVDIGDTVESILLKAGEIGMQNKIGGGSSGYFGNIRPRGAKIGEDGKSNGTVAMMEIYQTISNIISQPNRRGHFSATLDIEHDDFHEFIRIRSEGHPIQDLSFSVSIGDDFMNRLLKGDEDCVERFRKVVKSRYETGFPYIFFRDTVNRNTVDVYKDNGHVIKHSNMCVHGDTLILTDKGYLPIQELADTYQNIWNGKEFSRSFVSKTGENQKLLRVVTDSGQELECTPYHKFHVQEGYDKGTGRNTFKLYEKRAHELQKGDKLIKFNLPIIEGSNTLDFAYDNGFYTGDGYTVSERIQGIYLYGEKKELLPFLKSVYRTNMNSNSNRITCYSNTLKHKYFVPDASYSIESRLEWLSGLTDADGCVTNNNGSQSIQLVSIHFNFLKKVQLMLQTLGVNAKIKPRAKAAQRLMPKNNGTGEYGFYNCKDSWILLISGNGLFQLSELGFKTNRLKWVSAKPNRDAAYFIKIESVEEVEGLHDTYCFNEPIEHKGMFNGILTGNCHEIALPDTEDETFVCNLLGMNIEKFDEWKDNDAVEVGIYFMDAMLTDFITKNEDSYYMQSAVRFAKRHRAMGMGASGYHDYLQERMIPFESMQAKGINNRIFKTIKDQAYAASEKMAQVYGRPEYLSSNEYKRRHTTLLCVAPNTSSAFVTGQQSQSIEPHVSNYYVKDVAKMRIPIKNRNLVKLLEEKGENKDHVWEDILQHKGSVQHLPFLSEEEKQVFKTFSEISQLEILIQASSRQNHIDQSQSLNLMIPANLPIEDTAFLIIKAWELGIKTLYYQLNVSAAQELNIAGLARCISCEG